MYAAAQTFQNKPTNYARSITKLGIPQPPHYPIGVKRIHVNSPNVEGTVSSILKLQATFLYSIYHQRAGKTNLFHMKGGRFQAGNTLYTAYDDNSYMPFWHATHGLCARASYACVFPGGGEAILQEWPSHILWASFYMQHDVADIWETTGRGGGGGAARTLQSVLVCFTTKPIVGNTATQSELDASADRPVDIKPRG